MKRSVCFILLLIACLAAGPVAVQAYTITDTVNVQGNVPAGGLVIQHKPLAAPPSGYNYEVTLNIYGSDTYGEKGDDIFVWDYLQSDPEKKWVNWGNIYDSGTLHENKFTLATEDAQHDYAIDKFGIFSQGVKAGVFIHPGTLPAFIDRSEVSLTVPDLANPVPLPGSVLLLGSGLLGLGLAGRRLRKR